MTYSNQKIYSLDELKALLSPVFREYDVKRAVLFGSYGKGTATPKSDVDLVVDSGLKGLRFVGLIDDIRMALDGKDVDVFDVSHVESGSAADHEIKDTGLVIYAR